MLDYHLHLAIFFLIAFISASAVYLYLMFWGVREKATKIAGLVLLLVVVVNSAICFAYYGFNYTRMSSSHPTSAHTQHSMEK